MAGVWKRDGTVAVTNGNKKVTGTGTTFADTKNGVAKGHLFCITSGTSVDFYEVDYVVSNTELYLVQAYRGTTATGKAYEIITTFSDSVPEFARRLTATLSAYQQQSDAFQALLTSSAATIEVTAPDGTKQTLIPWKRVTSEGEGQAARAKTEADKAAASAALAGDIVAASAHPLPDVWAPLSDSLRLITGYGREVKVGEDVVSQMVNFSRSTAATYIGKDGLLRTAAVNEPRFEKEGLLIEGQSTNIVQASNSFIPFGGGTTKTEGQAGPFGQNDATKFDVTTRYGGTNPLLAASLTDNGVYTFSVWLKGASGGEVVRIGIHNGGIGIGVTLTSSWARYSVTQTRLAGANAACVIQSDATTASFYVYGAQLEALPFASSYIPTNGAAVTRGTDRAWIQTTGNIAAAPFTVAMEVNFRGLNSTGRYARLFTCAPACYAFFTDIAMAGRFNTSSSVTAFSLNPIGRSVSGMVFNGETAKLFSAKKLGAASPITALSAADVSGDLTLGSTTTLSSSDTLYGHVRNVRIWHSALTDEQIKALK